MNDLPKPVRAADFSLGAGMAFLAGATDVYGLARLHDIFVSFMSGNTIALGTAMAQGDWLRAGAIGGVIAMFVTGAALGSVLGILTGRAHRPAVAGAVTLILAVPLVWPSTEVLAFVIAMGALNASMNKVGSVAISVTYVTGALVKFGQGVGHALCGKSTNMGWVWQLPMWLSLIAGVIAANWARSRLATGAEWPLPLLALVVTIGALAHSLMARIGTTR